MDTRSAELRVGFGEADLTPPPGLLTAGSLAPRANQGTHDSLLAKALVAESGGRKLAVVGADAIGLPREVCDRALAEIPRSTGIDRSSIVISCSHTHSGPYTSDFYSPGATDSAYLSTLPRAIARSVEQANAACHPARMLIGRFLVHAGLDNRRVRCADGKALNTWMPDALNDLDEAPQILGASDPIDPEVWVARFDDTQGETLGVLFNFSLHANAHFGLTWSADFPGVVAESIGSAFGPDTVTVFTPGACGDINPTATGGQWREGAARIADHAVRTAKRAVEIEPPVVVDTARRDIRVRCRDSRSHPNGAAQRLNWGRGQTWDDVFRRAMDRVASMPEEIEVPVSAAHLGPLAIASNPGELFAEHGLTIKGRSRFRYSVVAALTNDAIGYEPTKQASKQEGYETLVGPNRVSIDGIEQIIDTAASCSRNCARKTCIAERADQGVVDGASRRR